MDHPSNTLRHVLDTTEKLAAEIGCQNTTLQEIIKRSGMSKGAIYHYVQSKDELFGLILQEHMVKKVDDYHGKAAGHPGSESSQHPHAMPASHPHGAGGGQGGGMPPFHGMPSGKLGPLSVIIKGLLQPANERQIVLRRCFIYLLSKQEQPDVAKILTNLHQSWIDFTAQWIEVCQRNGMIPAKVRPRKTAAFIISVLFGLMVQKSIAENQPIDEESGLDTDMVLESVAGMLGLEP